MARCGDTSLGPGHWSFSEAQYINFYYANFGKNKVQYRDFKWKIYHSPHFDVYYYPEDLEGHIEREYHPGG